MRNIINGGGGQPVGTITGGGGQPIGIGGGGQPIYIGGGGQPTISVVADSQATYKP